MQRTQERQTIFNNKKLCQQTYLAITKWRDDKLNDFFWVVTSKIQARPSAWLIAFQSVANIFVKGKTPRVFLLGAKFDAQWIRSWTIVPWRPTNKFIVFTCHLRWVTCTVAKITSGRHGKVHKRHCTVQQQRSWVKSVMHNNTWAINYNYYTLQQHAWASGSWDPPQAAQVPQSYIAIAPLRVLTPLGSVCAVILMWLNMKIAVYEMFFELQLDFDESFSSLRIVRWLEPS